MGLFSIGGGTTDVIVGCNIVERVAANWAKYGTKFPVRLEASRPSVMNACQVGGNIFLSRKYFPPEPGPFKRAAAFVVIGRLYPFFKVRSSIATPLSLEQKVEWLCRFLVHTIPLSLRNMSMTLGDRVFVLDRWSGFPSLHYRLEFLGWLRWLDSLAQFETNFHPDDWQKISEDRLARMIMSAALMIEACYYSSPSPFDTSGCLANLQTSQKIDLAYDFHYPPVLAASVGPTLVANQ